MWLAAGFIIGLALVVAWAWWHLRVRGEAHRLIRESWQADTWHDHLEQHRRASAHLRVTPSFQQQVENCVIYPDISAWERAMIAKFQREYSDHADLRAQRRLDEVEL